MNLVDNALTWLYRGVAVFPVDWRTKHPAIGSWKPYQTVLPTEEQVMTWLSWHKAYGVVTGWDNLCVLDFDDSQIWADWCSWGSYENPLAALVRETTYRVNTARGVHLYVRSAVEAHSIKSRGFDLQSMGRYVVGENSLHPSGMRYESPNPNAPIVEVMDVRDIVPPTVFDRQEARSCEVILAQVASPANVGGTCGASRASITQQAVDLADAPLTGAQLLALAKRAIPIWEMLGIERHEIRDTGNGKGVTRCPFHPDEHPSLSVDFQTNRISCLAQGCTGRYGYSTLDVYMRANPGTSVMQAAHALTGL